MIRSQLNWGREDHVYVNANIKNNTSQTIRAEQSSDMREDYLPRAGDFYMTVVRFDIPNTFPIFYFKDGAYVITLSYNGQYYPAAVQFQNMDMNDSTSRSVWTFQQFVDMINDAFETAFNNLKLANPGAPQTEAPFMTYDNSTSFFTLWVEDSYDETDPNPIGVWFNEGLMRFFSLSFTVYNYGINLPNGRDYRFKITDNGNNLVTGSPNRLRFTQSVETLYQWYDFAAIIITTSDIPVAKEFKTYLNSEGNPIQLSILTDFIPGIDKDRSNFTYNANPYRLIDLDGNLPLKRFSFKVFWVDKDGNDHPYTLPPNYSMSIKFGFFRKYV